MQDYIIMTDSCCDLTDQMARELELEVLPLTMTMDGEEYPNTLDGRYITNEEFYKRLRAGKTSTTAAANVGQFEDAMPSKRSCTCFREFVFLSFSRIGFGRSKAEGDSVWL